MSARTMDSSSETEKTLTQAPDGGFRAWFHVFLLHMVFFNTWGITNSYGIYQQYYTETLGKDSSSVAWIGGVPMFLLFFGGVFAGRASDAGYFRHCFVTGVALQVLGMIATSFSTEYYQILLAQGVCVGLGNGLVFTPGLSVSSSYFKRHRKLAVGLGSSGAAIGGMVYPAIFRTLLYHSNVGYGWTIRIVAFVLLATHIPSIIGYRPFLQKRSTGPLVDWSAFRQGRFVFFAAGMFLNFWGLYMVFFFLGLYAKDKLGFQDTFSLIIILNGVGFIGRIVPSLVGELYVGGMNMIVIFAFAAGLCVYSWPAISAAPGLYTWVVIYGIIAGGLQSLFPALATQLAPEPDMVGTWTGMVLSIVSFALLSAAPIQGAMIQAQDGSYLSAQILSGSSIIAGTVCLALSRWCQVGAKLFVKI